MGEATNQRLYERLFEHGLTRVDAERAHHWAFGAIRTAGPALRGLDKLDQRWSSDDRRSSHHRRSSHDRRSSLSRPVEALGLRFPNPLGLAAGFDKNAVGHRDLAGLGFGHVEVGTVTALAQPGNPRPRLFRLPADRAIVNRMGFNNDGAAAVAERLATAPARRHVLGVNIGKSKVVPDDDQAAVEADYATSTRLLAPHADYLVVNVSSPNTPGLRNLQAVEKLAPLLQRVRAEADAATVPDEKHPGPADSRAFRQGLSRSRVPLLVKIAPDLADPDVAAVADMVGTLGLDGIIATNTTISRDGLRSDPADVEAVGAGGLSGAPLRERAAAVLRLLRARVGPDLTLIGVGGISTPEDARERLAAGATLVQAYSGFVYGGPLWPRRVVAHVEASRE